MGGVKLGDYRRATTPDMRKGVGNAQFRTPTGGDRFMASMLDLRDPPEVLSPRRGYARTVNV